MNISRDPDARGGAFYCAAFRSLEYETDARARARATSLRIKYLAKL